MVNVYVVVVFVHLKRMYPYKRERNGKLVSVLNFKLCTRGCISNVNFFSFQSRETTLVPFCSKLHIVLTNLNSMYRWKYRWEIKWTRLTNIFAYGWTNLNKFSRYYFFDNNRIEILHFRYLGRILSLNKVILNLSYYVKSNVKR